MRKNTCLYYSKNIKLFPLLFSLEYFLSKPFLVGAKIADVYEIHKNNGEIYDEGMICDNLKKECCLFL